MQQDLQASHLACLDTTLTSKLLSFNSNEMGALSYSLTSKSKDICSITQYTIYAFIKVLENCKGLVFDILREKQHNQEQKPF